MFSAFCREFSEHLTNSGLGAAAERLSSAETEEDMAQAALSGRRCMEQLAEALFPPQNTAQGEQLLTRPAYRNRLWAFIAEHTAKEDVRFKALGIEVDRIVSEFNGGLHADRPKEHVAASLTDAAKLTAALLALNVNVARNPYNAYSEGIMAFVRKVVTP